MRKFTRFVVATGALGATLLGTVLVGAAPTSAAGTIGYTIIDNGDGTCDLATLDLTTGVLTDLPAASSPAACVADLAAGPDSIVWGIAGDTVSPTATPAAPVASDVNVVEFSEDGTPNPTPVFLDDSITSAVLAYGGIAVDPALGVLLQIGVNGTDPACPTGAGVCLLTYDPESGYAAPIGGSGLLSTPFMMLTSCSGGAYTIYDPDGSATASVDTTTGAVTDLATLDAPIDGYDCAPGTSTMYAISPATPLLQGAAPAALQGLGTLDPTTGQFTFTVAVSDADADIYALAVPGASAPVTTTTTTAAPAVADAAAVAPAFTG